MRLKDLKTGQKLGGAFGVLVILFLLVGAYNLISMSSIAGLTEKLFNHPLAVSNAVRDIEIEILSIHRNMKDVALAKDDAQIAADMKKVDINEKNALKHFEIVLSQFLGDKKDVIEARKLFIAWKPIRDEVVALKRAGKIEEAAAITKSKGAAHIKKLREKTHFLIKFADNKGNTFFSNALNTKRFTMLLTAIIFAGLVGIAILMALYITRVITKPLSRGVNIANAIADGDLTKRLEIETHDELGEMSKAFDVSFQKLESIIINATQAANENINSAEEISKGSMELASRTSQQAASVTETSATMEETASLVKQNSDNSGEAKEVLEGFFKETQEKMELINNVTTTMKEIDESGKQIDKIVTVINDISFQTNLLALNAAVEAARAGEAGRGFAVVATEVRNLAQKTAESSKTIQEIVNRNVDSTRKGMELVNKTSSFFTSNLQVVSDILNKVVLIADGSKEQSSGVEQINITVAQLEEVTNQNASLADELSASGKSMINNARELKELLGQFEVTR